LQALTISATFDGTGASGAYLPCCSIYSQAGALLARDFPSQVAAGSSAEVTYHPFLRSASGGGVASAGVEWARLTRTTSLTVTTVNPQVRVPWTAHQFTDSSLFTLKTVSSTNDTLTCHELGVYLVSGFAGWTGVVNFTRSAAIGSDMSTLNLGVDTPVTVANAIATDSGSARVVGDYQWLVPQTVPADMYLLVHNFDGSNRTVGSAFMGVFYWPNATAVV
jgi:hypothetical protein